MKKGDVIIKFNGKSMQNVAKFRIAVANSTIGTEIPVTIIRSKKEKTLFVTLVTRPDDLNVAPTEVESSDAGDLGLEVEGLNSEFAKQKNVTETKGVIVSNIGEDTPAARSGLSIGDIILEINQKEIDGIKNYNKIVDELKEDIILLYVKTISGNFQFFTINLEK